MQDELVDIGYVVKAHGVKGHFKIILTQLVKELSTSEALYFLIKGNKIPFFIEEIEYINERDIILLLEGITSKERAQQFAKKTVWTSSKYLLEETVEEIQPNTYENYTVIDGNGTALGQVVNFFDMQEYILIEIVYKGKEVLIPVHDNSIIKIDEKDKTLILKIPEGLLDVYINE
jgi:16S rRNA processing protein RimM